MSPQGVKTRSHQTPGASVGQAVKKGDTVVTLESMKMEIPMVAPQDGKVASIDVAAGDAVEAGRVLATLD